MDVQGWITVGLVFQMLSARNNVKTRLPSDCQMGRYWPHAELAIGTCSLYPKWFWPEDLGVRWRGAIVATVLPKWDPRPEGAIIQTLVQRLIFKAPTRTAGSHTFLGMTALELEQ